MASLLDHFVFPPCAHIWIYGWAIYHFYELAVDRESYFKKRDGKDIAFQVPSLDVFQLNPKANFSFTYLVNGLIYHDSVQILEACYCES